MKGKTLLCLSLVTSMLLSVFAIGPVGAQSTTIGVEPDWIVDPILYPPGSWFTVEIWVRNVVNLAAVEFKLAYLTSVLTATEITYGDGTTGIFGGVLDYFPLISEIYDDEGWLHYGIMELFGQDPFDGDGLVATINFTVTDVWESGLNLFDTKLGDPDGEAIGHEVLDGYFKNTYDVMVYSARLARRSAWPEHHHYSLSGDEDSSNDLFAIVVNNGDWDVWVQVVFTVANSTGIPFIVLSTDKVWLLPGVMLGNKAAARYKTAFMPPEEGKYYVTAECMVDADADGIPETPMGKAKSFSFSVVS